MPTRWYRRLAWAALLVGLVAAPATARADGLEPSEAVDAGGAREGGAKNRAEVNQAIAIACATTLASGDMANPGTLKARLTGASTLCGHASQ